MTFMSLPLICSKIECIDQDMDGSNVRVGVHGVKEVLADLV